MSEVAVGSTGNRSDLASRSGAVQTTQSLARGASALFDQALFSGCGFVVNVLLARWMDSASYGAFALAFMVFLLLSYFHNALIMEPMSVLGPARYANRLGPYFLCQLKLHAVLTSACAAGVLATGSAILWWRPGNELGLALVGMGAGLPFILLLWLSRRIQYVRRLPFEAAIGSALYLVLACAGLAWLRAAGRVSPLSAFVVLGAAALVASIVPLLRSRVGRSGGIPLSWRVLTQEQWSFGRWPFAASLLLALGTQAQGYLTATVIGLSAAGALRALEVLMLPMLHVITAIVTWVLPSLAQQYAQGNLLGMRTRARFVRSLLLGATSLYAVALLLVAAPLERLVYDGRFAQYAWLIPIYGLIPVLAALAAGPSLILRAAQRPQHYMIAAVVTAPIGLLSSLILVSVIGLPGAVASLVLVYAASATVGSILCATWQLGGVGNSHADPT